MWLLTNDALLVRGSATRAKKVFGVAKASFTSDEVF